MRKKKLDQLFQEKFKGFSEAPDEKVWRSIEASLNKKKKDKKAIALWWTMGSAAAIVLIALLTFNPLGKMANNPSVTDTENLPKKTKSIPLIEDSTGNDPFREDSLSKNTIVGHEKIDREIPLNQSEEANQNEVADSKKAPSNQDPRVTANKNPKTNGIHQQVVSNTKNSIDIPQKKPQLNSNIAGNGIETDAQNVQDQPNLTETVVANPHLHNNPNPEKSVPLPTQTVVQGTAPLPEQQKNGPMETEKQESIAQTDTAIDSLNERPKKSIYEEIAATGADIDVETDDIGGRWSVGPTLAPVYFNTLGEGSPIHPIFVANSKSGNTNLSYGLSVAYQINPRLSVRSGLHKVDFGYGTNEVLYEASLLAQDGQKSNITYSDTGKNLVLISNNSDRSIVNGVESLQPELTDLSIASTIQNGILAQQFGYLEVPTELEYALVDQKFGVNLIGGVSTLFLMDNSITLTTGNLVADVGKANNLNPINFSANAGIGLDYKFSKKLRFNIDPVFKYQLNTFSNSAGSFRPFSVGIYSGLNLIF